MFRNMQKLLLGIVLTGLLAPSCKKWDDHNAITDEALTKDLLQQITENKDLSKFTTLLIKTGYDKIISASKTFTVFAPTNAALATLDPALENDAPRLRLFVANHIATQSYYTTGTATRLQMLSEKYNNLSGKKLEDANITTADRYAKNGVLQVIDKMVPSLPNAWEFLESDPQAPLKQKNYLLSVFRNVFDLTNAIQTGIDPATGKPIYKPGTDSIRTNLFWRNVYDLRDESKQYTFFMVADTAWDKEVAKYSPYFATGSADSTADLTRWTIVKDLAVEGVYTAANIPDTILSKFNTKVGIDKSAIVRTVKTSNGVVFIMSKLPVRTQDKFLPYLIQAENFRSLSADRRGNMYIRDRYNPLTGKDFRDVLVYNHGLALFNLGYRLTDVPAVKYKAYWVAVNDNINNNNVAFTQKLGIGIATSTTLPYVNVALNDYNEIYLGEFTLTTYNALLDIYLTAANSTTATANPIVCDYIKLVPVL
jgi:hypothetical protein